MTSNKKKRAKKSTRVAKKASSKRSTANVPERGNRTPRRAEPQPDSSAESPSRLIDAKIEALSDWRGERLARLRALIKQADAGVVEEVKWRKPSNPSGVPVWSHDGIICTGETYKDKVKITFAQGAALDDPASLFNTSLVGNVRRAIDLHNGDAIDEKAFKALIRAAVALNVSKKKR